MAGHRAMRIGHGYDAHRLKPGRRLILAGVEIPHETGLDGHSDADVLVHALMDAILGAFAMGDIGAVFPDESAEFLDASSMELLRSVLELVRHKGGCVTNVDCTVIAQRPRLAPYVPRMRESLAAALEIPLDRVSVKATTEEGMGFTGSMEGICAHAVVLAEQQPRVTK